MSGSIPFDIKIGRIRAVYMPHNLRQITRKRLQQQVNGCPSGSRRECVHHIAVLRIQGIQENGMDKNSLLESGSSKKLRLTGLCDVRG